MPALKGPRQKTGQNALPGCCGQHNCKTAGRLWIPPFVIMGWACQTIRTTANECNLSERLIEALDLEPLMVALARHAGTRLGRDSILSLVNKGNVKKTVMGSNPVSARKTALTRIGISNVADTNGGAGTGSDGRSVKEMRQIAKIAKDLEEARQEWDLVEEAVFVLNASENGKRTTRYPPIYAEDSSPWDVDLDVDTDDEDWLFRSTLKLEDVLQADQVVNRLSKTYRWAMDDALSSVAPGLAGIGCEIEGQSLSELYEEIAGVVIIVRGGPSFNDPSGSKVCSSIT